MHKMLQSCVEDIKQVSSRSANHNYFFGEFCTLSMLSWGKKGPIFSSFNPCSSLPFVGRDDRKQCQCLDVVLDNKTGTSFLEFN